MVDINNLPTGWENESLNELCILNPRHDKNLSDDIDVSFVPMAAVDEKIGTISSEVERRKLGKVKKGYTHFADGDVIFAKITPCMENGKSAIAKNLCNGLACGSTEFYTLRSNGAIASQYLHPFLRQNSYINNASMNMTGVVGQRRVPKDFVLSTEIPLPPLNEQKRIVTKIEALQTKSTAVKEELEAIKPLLNQFRQSVLASAFRGDLTKDWRSQNPDVESAEVLLERIRVERRQRWEEAELEKMKAKDKVPKDDKWKKRYKEPKSIDAEGLPELPDGWCWISVEQFADVGTGATPFRKNTKYYDDGIIPWVTSGALNEIFIKTAEEYITPLAIDETNAKVFPKHTLLIAMYGEGKTRGKVSELLIEAATNQACAALILNGLASKIRPIVKLFFLKNYSDIRKIASGGVQPNLNLGMIKTTLVPLPPMNEQRAICSFVEQCMLFADNIEQDYQQATTDLETLNQSILAKAFRGELVPQDPNDEPASVLLERIREERDRAKAAAKKSKTKKKKKINNLAYLGYSQ